MYFSFHNVIFNVIWNQILLWIECGLLKPAAHTFELLPNMECVVALLVL